MSFGQRKFHSLVLVAGEIQARFLPLDFGAAAEYADEPTLRRAIYTNDQAAEPVEADEEKLGLSALEIFAKKNTNTHPSTSARAKQTRDAKKGA